MPFLPTETYSYNKMHVLNLTVILMNVNYNIRIQLLIAHCSCLFLFPKYNKQGNTGDHPDNWLTMENHLEPGTGLAAGQVSSKGSWTSSLQGWAGRGLAGREEQGNQGHSYTTKYGMMSISLDLICF